MTAKVFSRERLIRFSDCDPAGIVFYPEYFVMLNGLIEDWFNDELGYVYAEMVTQHRVGLPTVHLAVDFKSISRLGDTVTLALQVERIGGASLTLRLRCLGADQSLRLTMHQVLVTTSLVSHQAIGIPAGLRAAMMRWSND